MKKFCFTCLVFVLIQCSLFSQEVVVDISILDFFLDEDAMLSKYNSGTLPLGKWTHLDRLYNTSRFKKSMQYILDNNKTNLLEDLTQISAYYSYLGQHPKVVEWGVQWQNEASRITAMWQFIPISALITGLSTKIYIDLKQLSDPTNPLYLEYEELLHEEITKAGLDFIDGTASKRLVADVTKNYYNPLINGKLKKVSPFDLDCKILYREQFDILQPNYYDKFNNLDKFLITGLISESFALVLANMEGDIDLNNPSDRMHLGLRMMGYPDSDIVSFMSTIH